MGDRQTRRLTLNLQSVTSENAVDLRHLIIERIKDIRKVAACGEGRGFGFWPAALWTSVSEGDCEVRRKEYPPGAPLRDLHDKAGRSSSFKKFARSGNAEAEHLRHGLRRQQWTMNRKRGQRGQGARAILANNRPLCIAVETFEMVEALHAADGGSMKRP